MFQRGGVLLEQLLHIHQQVVVHLHTKQREKQLGQPGQWLSLAITWNSLLELIGLVGSTVSNHFSALTCGGGKRNLTRRAATNSSVANPLSPILVLTRPVEASCGPSSLALSSEKSAE